MSFSLSPGVTSGHTHSDAPRASSSTLRSFQKSPMRILPREDPYIPEGIAPPQYYSSNGRTNETRIGLSRTHEASFVGDYADDCFSPMPTRPFMSLLAPFARPSLSSTGLGRPNPHSVRSVALTSESDSPYLPPLGSSPVEAVHRAPPSRCVRVTGDSGGLAPPEFSLPGLVGQRRKKRRRLSLEEEEALIDQFADDQFSPTPPERVVRMDVDSPRLVPFNGGCRASTHAWQSMHPVVHDSDVVLHGISSDPPVPEIVPRDDKALTAPEYDSDESGDENDMEMAISEPERVSVPLASHPWLKRRRSFCEDDPESTAVQDPPCARHLRRVMVRGDLRGIAHDERRIG